MKRMIGLLLFIMLLFAATPALANSGPVFWEGFPGAETMAVDKDCPISVTNEQLTFDLSEGTQNSYAVHGQVTARYEMRNPTEDTIEAAMAFPFIGSLRDLLPGQVSITAGDAALPWTLYLGDTVDASRFAAGEPRSTDTDISFETIVSAIEGGSYQPQHFSADEEGTLYTFAVTPTGGEEIRMQVEYAYTMGDTRSVFSGFHGVSWWDSGRVQLSAWCGENREALPLELFVLGEDVEFSVTGYTDGEMQQQTQAFTYTVDKKTISVQDYLTQKAREYAQQIAPGGTGLTDTWGETLYDAGARELDKVFADYDVYDTTELFSALTAERMLVLVYTVDFPANETIPVCVRYPVTGTMDKTDTSSPVHSFTYLFEPARYWSGFENLDITVRTPAEAPYIVSSSMAFAQDGERQYIAHSDKLPQAPLTFSIYENQTITALDRAVGAMEYSFGYFLPVVVGAAVLLIAAVTVTLLIRRARRKRA